MRTLAHLLLGFFWSIWQAPGIAANECKVILNDASRLFHRGADVSSLALMENLGHKYRHYNRSETLPLESILHDTGFNALKFRLFVHAVDDVYGLDYTLALVRRAHKKAMQTYVSLSLSDSWGDPHHQSPSSLWKTNSVLEMKDYLYNYTKTVGDAFHGICPEIFSAGNEIKNGIVFPLGERPKWGSMSQLLKATVKGLRDSKCGKRSKIALHINTQGEWHMVEAFFDDLLAPGELMKGSRAESASYLQREDFDVIGHTLYNYYGSQATFENQAKALSDLHDKYGKEQRIVETSYPFACDDRTQWPTEFRNYPLGNEGQVKYINRIAQLPYITGIYLWEIAWLTQMMPDHKCNDVLWFEQTGEARASISIFNQTTTICTESHDCRPGLSN